MIDELDVVRRVGAAEDPADRAARERVRSRVLAGGVAPPRAPRRRRLVTVAAPAAAVALGAAFVLALAPGGGGEFASDERRGAATAPAVTAPAPELFPRPEEFLYVRSETRYVMCAEGASPGCRLGPERTREVWFSERRRGRILEQPSGGTPTTIRPGPYRLGNRAFDRAEIARYRPTPRELLAALRRDRVPGQGGGGASYPFRQIIDALREVPMPPAVRRAAIGALPLVPGVRERGEVTDSRGRPGLGFTRDIEGQREEVVIDPRTLTTLEERTILLDPRTLRLPRGRFRAGDVIGRSTFVERAVVEGVGERP